MRYIDVERLLDDAEFRKLVDAANAAQSAIIAAPENQRKDLIKQHRPKWVAFRDSFAVASANKCWYTESKNPGTDDDIDHFRPKSRVFERKDHPGYWWEALNWENFRLSCHRGNRSRQNPESGTTFGKADHFPISDEGDRWMVHDDTCNEDVLLLDPTDPEDPPLLTFDANGRAALAPSFASNQRAAERVRVSIELLHLDWPEFVENRSSLLGEVRRKVIEGNKLESAALTDGNHQAKTALKAVAKHLIRMTAADQPYSQAALAFVRMYQYQPWVAQFVIPHAPAQ